MLARGVFTNDAPGHPDIPKRHLTMAKEYDTMPNTPGERAIEYHNLASEAHLKAANSHKMGDHLSAHEQSRQAKEHAEEAHRHSEELAKKN